MAKPFNASLPQALAYNATQKFQYYKGGVRGGKTRIALRRIIKECIKQPGIKVLITRTTGPALYSTSLQDFDSEVPQQLLNKDKCLTKPNPVRVFANGSRVFFVAYDASDLGKLGSEEYGIIMLEEANMFPSNSWNWFATRLSQEWGDAIDSHGKAYVNKIKNTYMIAVANSGGRNWLWQQFRRDRPLAYFPWREIYGYFDRHDVWHPPSLPVEKWNQDPDYFAIEWGTRENKDNLRPDYWESLKGLPDHLFKRYAEADDEPLEGLVFPDFKRQLHVIPMKGFVPPPHWPVYVGMDYGRKTPTVALWITISEEGTFIAFKEYRATMKSPAENASNILAIDEALMKKGMPPHKVIWIDLSTGFHRGESEMGASIFDQLVENGLNKLAKSSRDLDGRVARMTTAMLPIPFIRKHPVTGQILETGWPRLMLTNDCEDTIRELEEWEYPPHTNDKKDASEKPEEKDDHGCDAFGYVLIKTFDKAPLDFDSQRIKETSVAYELDKEKDEWCAGVMNDRDSESMARNDGAVF